MTNDFNPIEPESVEQAAISPETVRETRLPDGSPTPELTEGGPKRDG
ncbi:MAG: peptide ABC transporter permease, partial [Dermacoccus nishinomiyaensis]